MELIKKLESDANSLHHLAAHVLWIAKEEIHTRILMVREHIIDAIKKLKEVEGLKEEIQALEDRDPFENVDPIHDEGHD